MVGFVEALFRARKQDVAIAVIAVTGFALGFFLDALNVRTLLLALFGVVAGAVLAAPYAWAIRILFFYLCFEGMAKMLTHYHPVVHVGADILVAALTGRWILTLILQRTRIPSKKDLPPLWPLFLMHIAWFMIQFVNPYSIGLVPSLAAAKIYVTMLLLYIFGFYLADDVKKVRWFMAIWVFAIVMQVTTGLYQASVGPASVLALSSAYALPLAKFDASYAFRPFGTTHLPGGASLFVFLGAPFVVYFIFAGRSLLNRLFLVTMLPGMGLLLMLCQVRAALLKAIVGVTVFTLIALARASERARRRMLIAVPVLVALIALALPAITSRWVAKQADSERAIQRSLTLFDIDRAKQARRGAADRVVQYATELPLGAGLSRTGPAADKFAGHILSNPHYSNFFFTDNFWAAIIAELGIPGALVLTGLILSILIKGAISLKRTADPDRRLVQAAILCSLTAIVIGLWGAEGILYNPEAAFFWFFAGVLMRFTDHPEPVQL